MDKQAAAALNEQQGKLRRLPDRQAARLHIVLIPSHPHPFFFQAQLLIRPVVTCVINSVCAANKAARPVFIKPRRRRQLALATLISGQLVILDKCIFCAMTMETLPINLFFCSI